MAPTAWQLACGLDAWRITQIPRRPELQAATGPGDDHGDVLAGQRAAALGAAYHGGAGPVGFAWVRDRSGGPVQVLAAGQGLAVAARERDVVLKVPAGGRGEAAGAGGLARALGVLPCWVRIAGVADSLLAAEKLAARAEADGQAEPGGWAAGRVDGAVRLAGAGRAGRPRRAAGAGVRGVRGAGRGAAVRQPAGAAGVRRLQDRHAELRQAASAGLWRVHVLAGAAGGREAAEVAGLLCASADLGGLPYGLVPVPECGRLDEVLDGPAVRADPSGIRTGPPGSLQPWPAPPQVARQRADEDDPEPASPFYGSSAVLAALARPPAREIPGSARFVLRPEFDTIPETAAVTGRDRGIRARRLAGPRPDAGRGADAAAFIAEPAHVRLRGHRGGEVPDGAGAAGAGRRGRDPVAGDRAGQGRVQRRHGRPAARRRGDPDPAGRGRTRPRPGSTRWSPRRGPTGRRFPLQTHADLVKSLFLAAFEADEPFPQVLNAALTRVYDEHGWDLVLGEPKTPGVQPGYPSLGDLQAAADMVVREAAYGPEVERNVRGFITVRLGSLRLGTPGRFFEGGHQLDFAAAARPQRGPGDRGRRR